MPHRFSGPWACFLVLLQVVTLAGCQCESAGRQSNQAMPFSDNSPLSTVQLLDSIAPYYPRWNTQQETLNDYIERYQQAPEFLALRRVCARALEHDDQWRALLHQLRALFPDHFIQDAVPPWDTIPSYQVVIGYDYPPGSDRSKYLVFRLSHFAPVFDYHEIDRDADEQRISVHQRPTLQAAPVARKIAREIVKHFEHRWLAPDVGKTPVPDLYVATLFPGEVTLADALFGESPTW